MALISRGERGMLMQEISRPREQDDEEILKLSTRGSIKTRL